MREIIKLLVKLFMINHLFTGTEGTVSFVPWDGVVKRGEAEFNNIVEGTEYSLFPEVLVNKCFVM